MLNMPKRERTNDADSDADWKGPAAKRICLCVQLERLGGRQLTDFPLEIMGTIFGYARCANNLMLVNTRLKSQYIAYMLHRQRSFKHSNRNQPLITAVMKVLHHATDYAVQGGYEAHYIYNLQALLDRTCASTSIRTMNTHLRKFICHFYASLEMPLGSVQKFSGPTVDSAAVQHRRILLTMSLLNMLKQFRFFKILSSEMKFMHWQLKVEVKGIFLDMLEQFKWNASNENLSKNIQIIALMAEILLHDMLEKKFACIKTVGKFTLKYGLNSKMGTRLILRFSILASTTIIRVLQMAIAGEIDLAVPIEMTSDMTFSVRLELIKKLHKAWTNKNFVLHLAKSN
ncbi:uncharacterized protein LOC111070701 [Drosophila obscura]|uniref:uncharacterized protein LOC111070701 n=1 Tax=Drosophila obscura TaxID=7282 RepID=UPI000B9F9C6F|nr:uncharacterized protein LOC111070701 [Drosophila obscura]